QYRHLPPGRSSYGTYRVDCSRYAASRPHSRTFASSWDECSHARCTPPSCATLSSPYSRNTRSYSCSARSVPAELASRDVAPAANSSRKSRRSDFGEREYRANSAPFVTSGRLTSPNTGPVRLVKYGARAACSLMLNSSAIPRDLSTTPPARVRLESVRLES